MKVTEKWRPSLGLLITAVVAFLVILPIGALMAARVTSNQFVRETEASLHAQAAIFAAQYAQAFMRVEPAPEFGVRLTDQVRTRLAQEFHPVEAGLVRGVILPPRPDPVPVTQPLSAAYAAISADLSALAAQAQKTTLVGVLAVDHLGQIVSRSGAETGLLVHVDEINHALSGEIMSAARWREDEYRNHSIRSISRDTKFRVFVSHPVVVSDRVVGAVYLSRTPSNLNKYIFQQRNTFAWLFGAVALSATFVGFFLWRFLSRPLGGLSVQAAEIAQGNPRERLPNYGVREIASLGQSIMDMGGSLRKQADTLETYTKHATHELKSPVTSIMGAAELLEGDKVSDERRAVLAAAIKSDALRMDQLLIRMREMVRGQAKFDAEPVCLTDLKLDTVLNVSMQGDVDALLPLPKDAAMICLRHFFENAVEHGARNVVVSYDQSAQALSVRDDGAGLSVASAKQATEPFFTTKRDAGGTGMGLAICTEIVAQYGGVLSISDAGDGALVRVMFGNEK